MGFYGNKLITEGLFSKLFAKGKGISPDQTMRKKY